MKKEAFTLVELVVTISIITLLTIIGFTSFTWYIASSKDSMRVTQIATLNDTLETYKLKKALPLPDSYVQVKDGTELIAYQWYAWESVLSSLWIEKKWWDFKDGFFYSYYVTKSRRSFQLMTFLENGEELNILSLTPSAFANSKNFTYPYVVWYKLWIITDVNNTPIQEVEAFKTNNFDIASIAEEYIIHLTSKESLQWGNAILQNLKTTALVWWKFCKIDGIGIFCNDPNISEYQKYPDCPASTVNSQTNEAVYNHWFVNNSIYVKVTWVEVLQAETNSYVAVMYCDKWTWVISWEEELIGTVCNQWYLRNGVACEPPDLYAFTNHTFSNCSATWKNGPTLINCRSAYNTTWDEDNNFYYQVTENQGYQLWTVPSTATYTINAYGWSTLWRKWARIQWDFSLVKGEQLMIVVGQKWTKTVNGEGWAGGTFVVKANSIPANVSSVTPLIVAGWAGWEGWSGSNKSCSNTDAHYLTTAWKNSCNNKAGWTNGSDGTTTYGWKWFNSFSNLIGKNAEEGWEGWFWGGGWDQNDNDNGGGGGWYSWGGGAFQWNNKWGGGGWSYNAWLNQLQWLAPSVNVDGYVIITKN